MARDTYYFASLEKTPTELVEVLEKFYGPTMNAVEAAQKNGKAEENTQTASGTIEHAEQEQDCRYVYTRHFHAHHCFRLTNR